MGYKSFKPIFSLLQHLRCIQRLFCSNAISIKPTNLYCLYNPVSSLQDCIKTGSTNKNYYYYLFELSDLITAFINFIQFFQLYVNQLMIFLNENILQLFTSISVYSIIVSYLESSVISCRSPMHVRLGMLQRATIVAANRT